MNNSAAEEQRRLRLEAISIIEKNCKNCKIIQEKRKQLGNKKAYKYCVDECPVALELQENINKQYYLKERNM